MGIAAFLSLRYWRRRRLRAGATLIGVALGVALMVSVGLINDSILRTYEGLSRTLAGRAHLELRALLPAGIDERWLDVVRSQKGVAAVAPVLEQRSFLLAGTRQVPVRLRGIDPAADDAVRPQQIVAGRGLRTGDMTAMVVAQSLALALDVRVGATVDLLTPAGLASFHVVGVSTGLDPLSSPQSRVALVGLGALQGAYLEGQARVSEIDVVAQDAASVAGLERELESLLGGVAFVARPREEARDLAAVTDGLRFMLLLAGLMALVAAAYLIANNVAAAVDDRRRDLAVVRALGMGRAQVRAWLMGETLVLATGGSLLGAGAGVVAAWILARTLPGQLVTPYGVPLPRPGADPVVLLAGLGAGLLIALVAAYPSVRSSSRDTVSVALATAGSGARGGEAHDGGLQRWLLPLGLAAAAVAAAWVKPAFAPAHAWSLLSVALVLTLLVMAASGLPMLMWGVSASIRRVGATPLWLRLAADSVRRNRRRTSSVAASLMITLTILVGVFGMARSYRTSVGAWVDSMVGWDLMVSAGSHGGAPSPPLSPALRYELETIPGVALASPERFANVRYGNRALPLYAYRFRERPRIRRFTTVDGASGDALASELAGGRAVAVSASLAPQLGLSVGDDLALRGADGEIRYRVAAVVQDPGAASGAVYMDRDVYVRDWDDRAVDDFALLLTPGADASAVARRVQDRFRGRFVFDVVSAAMFREQILGTVGATFALSQGLIVVAVLVAIFGLLNAALIGAWQLRHQLAVLRALGAPNALLARTLIAEAWLTGAAGGATGLVLGTLLSVALLRGLQASGAPVLAWRWPVPSYVAVALLLGCASVAAGAAAARAVGRGRAGESLRPE